MLDATRLVGIEKAQPSSYATLAHHKPIEPYREVCALAHTLTGSNYLPESLGRGGDSSDDLSKKYDYKVPITGKLRGKCKYKFSTDKRNMVFFALSAQKILLK